MLEFVTFRTLPAGVQDEFAKKISNYTNGLEGEQPQMLPVEPEDIHTKMGLVALRDREFAGYIGALDPIEHHGSWMSEVGTLWVPEGYRGQKIATILSLGMSLLLENDGVTPYVFCNPLSQGVFAGIGYVQAAGSEVPTVALEACATCPSKPASGCCDTILIKESPVWI